MAVLFSDLSNLIYICATITLLGFLSQYFWLGDLCTQFRPHMAVVSALLFVPLFLLRKRQRQTKLFAGILTICLLANIVPYLLVPSAPFANKTVKNNVTVLQYNIYSGNTMTEGELKLITSLDADIVCIEELSPVWEKILDGKLKQLYPSQFTHPRLDNFGLAILSKYKLLTKEILTHEYQVPSMAVQLEAPSGAKFLVIASHPEPPRADNAYKNRDIVIKELGKYIESKTKADPSLKVIWTGDFNAASWSGQLASTLSDINLKEAKPPLSMASWPVYAPAPLRIYLDHVFVSSDLKCRQVKMPDSPGSDHRPILVKLAY